MGRIPDEIIQLVRDRVDTVDLIGRYVSLRAAGRNHKGLCPFHQEKTPSFTVNSDRQTFKCFGCGEGGNALDLVAKIENVSIREAAILLVDWFELEGTAATAPPTSARRLASADRASR